MYNVTIHSTQFGSETPHGSATPHMYPQGEENSTGELMNLVRQLYPTGRAFNIPERGVFESLHTGINVSFLRLINDGLATINSIFPDNEGFTDEDAELWEYRLGLFINPAVSLELRKMAIKRKMAYPSNIKARQHPLFIEKQLQLAGFNVYIHENRFYENGVLIYKTPADVQVNDEAPESVLHGEPTQHGVQHGAVGFDVIANLTSDEIYGVGGDDNLWATFFIGGKKLGYVASVPENRKREFKELVLKLKPAHTVAFTFINYL